MAGRSDAEFGEVFVISVAAELSGMHAQTLRTYDRLGLVTPQRTRGGGRRYSRSDVELLRTVQRLSQEEGVNLAGIKAIIELKKENKKLHNELMAAREELDQLKQNGARPRGEIVHVPRSTAVVMWEPRRGKRS
ncbi:helix-turn-helix transcriptional regulator [Corynebacterium pseudotuberculosis]|uniref:MerR family transcriptional regulator n=1 Tax=Corynebacterium pseudotuberculosis 258 TaxID=1168865 RepID=A0AAU8QH22_CORPS|nr:helix-turn-helix transcriptional regulator [Corynebacterium pseudotuberculosis]AER69890.1 Heat shock protein HspR [Corynebacterium pseudotuberculosis 1/06-A]AEQ07424.1 MerR family transcriptional regulator [Corynebacterium pseudotuberculosis CIP 52.97]AFB73233.1 MerR family transcriptional regulator [Corynebacterium pseudotuberculosis 316]AFH91686.1 MerR family transcriptional regulator [Corynebacterium pseudotuberculosis 31]AFK17529.1 MerR family transcriptional regulator [Corynebacterium 